MNDLYRAKEKKMAYLLHKEFGYTRVAIAKLMKISPQQMGQWIKEVNYELQIHNLKQELDSIKEELIQIGYFPQKALDSNDFIDIRPK
jgi:predicted transcriptional regulator